MTNTRPPAVAGMFYPGNPAELMATVDALLATAKPINESAPKVLIVPHAGYIYSGSTAAMAFASLAPLRQQIKRVILLGPTHRVAVNGIAVPEASAFATPLGNIPLDLDTIAQLRDLPQIVFSDRVHAQEHSLEVHLPLLQRVLGDFKLVPLAVGEASPQAVAEVLNHLWGGPETLIVVSSDLSHYLPYAEAQEIDRATADSILRRHALGDHEQACGATPINGLLEVARRRNLTPTLLDLRNSGDTAGDKSRVVGYAAFTFTEAADD